MEWRKGKEKKGRKEKGEEAMDGMAEVDCIDGWTTVCTKRESASILVHASSLGRRELTGFILFQD